MLTKLTLIFSFFETVINMFKKNKLALILTLFSLSLISYYNYDNINSFIFGEKDIAKEYIEQTFIIENDLDIVRNEIEANEIAILMLHNGEITLSRTHLLKFTMLFQSVDTMNNNKFIVYRYHLAPYVKYFKIMLNEGYYYVEDTQNHPDVLIRRIFSKHHRKSIIYIPLFKDGKVVAFASASWTKSHKLTNDEIHDFIRLMDIPENHL